MVVRYEQIAYLTLFIIAKSTAFVMPLPFITYNVYIISSLIISSASLGYCSFFQPQASDFPLSAVPSPLPALSSAPLADQTHSPPAPVPSADALLISRSAKVSIDATSVFFQIMPHSHHNNSQISFFFIFLYCFKYSTN